MSETRRICVSLPAELEQALMRIRAESGKTYSHILAELAAKAIGLDIEIPGPGPTVRQKDRHKPLPPTPPVKQDKRLVKRRRVLDESDYAF